jgi:integrase
MSGPTQRPDSAHTDARTHWRRRVWQPAGRRAGLEHLTFHDLLRANATTMVLEGVDLKTAQTRLGYSDPRLALAVYAQRRPRVTDPPPTYSARRSRAVRGLLAAWPRPRTKRSRRNGL